MKTIAVYNLKGGVGKTTASVNLSYLAATNGQRALLWDLDPQAASSFAFRVQPRVEGFGRKSLRNGQAFGAAIRQTDYPNLDLLPADFAYRTRTSSWPHKSPTPASSNRWRSFASRDPATAAFAEIWAELQGRLAHRVQRTAAPQD